MTGRQADRQTGRQADRQTGRQADRQTGRQADRQTGRQADNWSARNSGVELLKIIALFLIVVSHVTQTLYTTTNTYVGFDDYVIPIGNATTDINILIMMLFSQLGPLANNIFFVCSAWYYVGRTGDSKKKGFSLLCTVWGLSIVIFLFYLGIGHYNFSIKDILRQFFPTTIANNWYITCYILFLFVYPYLNKLVAIVSQKQLLRIVIFSVSLWIIANYVKDGLFFTSALILWVTIYFLIAYIKLYCKMMIGNPQIGLTFIVIGIVGFIGQVIVTNIVGLHVSLFNDKVMRWNNNCSPFYILIAIGSLIIALQSRYKVRLINYVSSLSLFVYLIHENYLFRNYTRPLIWQWLYNSFGYVHVVLLDLGFALLLFITALLLSALYKVSLEHIVERISNSLYGIVSKTYRNFEVLMLED